MRIEPEVKQFAEKIGAIPLYNREEVDPAWSKRFRDMNYFRFEALPMIVKFSETEDFWGVRRSYIGHFNANKDFYLVLIEMGGSGWMFRKVHVNAFIEKHIWKVAGDGDYKINVPLPDSRRFLSAKHFLKKLRLCTFF